VSAIDLGQHMLKGVALRERAIHDSFDNLASRPVPKSSPRPTISPAILKQLFTSSAGARKRVLSLFSDPSAILRIMSSRYTGELLRTALRLNGLAVLNQECRDSSSTCLRSPPKEMTNRQMKRVGRGRQVAVQSGVVTKTKYLVGGMLRSQVKQIAAAAIKFAFQPTYSARYGLFI